MSTALIRPTLPSWIRSQKREAPVPVLLGDRDHEAEIGLDHLLLGLARLALSSKDRGGNPPELGRLQAGVLRQRHDVAAKCCDLGALLLQGLPALAAQPADARQPGRLQLAAFMLFEKRPPRDAAFSGQPQKRTIRSAASGRPPPGARLRGSRCGRP